jgi:phenylacetate-CoA ligase
MFFNNKSFEPGCALHELSCALKKYFNAYKKDAVLLSHSHLWSRQQILNYQQERFSDVVKYVHKYVPYYRGLEQIYDYDPTLLKTGDISRFPFLTRADIHRRSSELMSEATFFMPVFKNSTAYPPEGTVTLYHDFGDAAFREALWMRQLRWAGVNPNDRFASLRGERVPAYKSERSVHWQFGFKKLVVDTAHLDEENVQDFVAIMERTDVKYVVGHPSRIYQLALCMQEKGMVLPLKAVLTTDEPLDVFRRRFIEDVFLCRVFDYYETQEGVAVIHTCEKGRYHISPEYSYVELLENEDLPPGYYELVGTSFWNRAMPLIRFRTGDVVKASDTLCTCGCAFPVIDAIVGRQGRMQDAAGDEYHLHGESRVGKVESVRATLEGTSEKGASRIQVELCQ